MKVCKGSLQEVLVQRSCQIPSIRSFFDDCVKFSLRSCLEVLEFLFTDVFLNAARAFFARDDCLYFLFEKVESRAAFDKSGGRPPLYLGRTCQADRRRYAYLVLMVFQGVPIRYVSNHILYPCVIEGKIIM